MSYDLILASEVAEGFDPIGHAWVAVEYPKDVWIARGFYPEGVGLGIVSGTTGRIRDDWDTFKMARVRTKTFRGLSDRQMLSAKTKILEYGGSLHDPKPPLRHGRRQSHVPSPDSPSVASYALVWDQCATFAIAVCKAAGIDPMPFRPQTPINIWNYLGAEGERDAAALPGPFHRR